MGISMPDLAAAIGGPFLHENLKAEGCQAMEAALLRMIQQPSVAEPVRVVTAAPRPAGPPHAGTCPLPEVSNDLQQPCDGVSPALISIWHCKENACLQDE